MLVVAENQDWDPAKRRALSEEAFKFEPGYYYCMPAYAQTTCCPNGPESRAILRSSPKRLPTA
jgi:hypothetical protein